MAANERIRYVVYYRYRPSDREASEEAFCQQQAVVESLVAQGHEIVGEFMEFESADPDESWLEARPQLKLAYEMARRLNCELAILRVDPIGEGDEFYNPIPFSWGDRFVPETHCDTAFTDALLLKEEYLHGRPIPEAVAQRFASLVNAPQPPLSITLPQDAPRDVAIYVDLGFGRREAPVYLCNGTGHGIEGYYENDTDRRVAGDDNSSGYDLRDAHRFSVEPGHCEWLFSFEQGRWRGETSLYRFFFGGSRSGQIADLVIGEGRFKEMWRFVHWRAASNPTEIGHPSQ